MSYDTGYSRRSSSERDLQPVAIVAVDPVERKATGVTRTRHTVYINCAYATGDTITTPAVGEQWFVERVGQEWRLYGRIPFNDATLNIKAEEGQVSVGSASGPLELNGTEVRLNGETVRLNGVYYRDDGNGLQRSEDKITWDTVLNAVEGDTGAIQLISEALTNFTGTDQQAALEALKEWSGVLGTLADTAPDAWGSIMQTSFIDGLRRMGNGDTEIAKVVDGGQNFVDYLFGTIFCDFDGNLTPQTILARTRDLVSPISKRPLISKFVATATQKFDGDPTHENDTFLEKVFYGFESIFEGLGGNSKSGRRKWGNLLIDPGAEFEELWFLQSDVIEWVGDLPERPDPNNADITLPADPTRHGLGQIKIVSAGSTPKTFWWTIDELGEPEWLDVQEGDIFYAECYVRCPVRNAGFSNTAHLVVELKNSKTGETDRKYINKEIFQDETWRLTNKVAGHITIPGPKMKRLRYRTPEGVEWDQVRFGFELVTDHEGDEFFIDDMVVKEITGVQRILKGVHEPIFGDSIEYPTYDDLFKGIWSLRRHQGINLLADPHIRKPEYWANIPSVEVVNAGLTHRVRSGFKSLQVNSGGTTEVSFDWMRDENSVVYPILTEAEDIFYCEAWVFAPLTNNRDSVVTLRGTAVDTTSEDPDNPGTFNKTVDIFPEKYQFNYRRGGWHKFSGYFIMPQPSNVEGQEAIYDGFLAGIALKSGDTDVDDVFYVDDLVVREATTDEMYASPQRIFGNILLDPGAEFPHLWTPQIDMVEWVGDSETDPAHHGVGQLKIVSGGATAKTFWWTVDESGTPEWVDTKEGEIFFAECWVRSPIRNSGISNTVHLILELRNSKTGDTDRKYITKEVHQDADWRLQNRISGHFTVPGPTMLRPRYRTDEGVEWDQVRFGFELVAGQTFGGNETHPPDEFFIDDMVVKEITGVQRILKGVHEPIFGDSIEYPTYDDLFKGIWSLRSHQRVNLLADPHIRKANYWANLPGVEVVTAGLAHRVRSGFKSLKLTSAGTTEVSFDWMRDENSVVFPILTEAEDIFYVECWVYAPLANDPDSILTLYGTAVDTTSEDPDNPGTFTKTVDIQPEKYKFNYRRGGWHRFSAYFIMPQPSSVEGQEAIYDGFLAGIALRSGETQLGDDFYVDDLMVREANSDEMYLSPQRIFGNLLLDPGAEFPHLWTPQIDVVEWAEQSEEDPANRGNGSLKVVSSGATAKRFWWTVDESGSPEWIDTKEGEIFYAECWVRSPVRNQGVSSTVHLVLELRNSKTGATDTKYVTKTINQDDDWRLQNRIFGHFTVPGPNLVRKRYRTLSGVEWDQVRFGFELVAGQTFGGNETHPPDEFFIDDMVVKEITGVQRILKNIHEPIFGDTIEYPTYDDLFKGIWNLRRRLGPNLLADPHVRKEEYWAGINNVEVVGPGLFTHNRSGAKSLKITAAGMTPVSFDWMRDENSVVFPILTEAQNIFYAECWVYAPLGNDPDSILTLHGIAVDTTSEDTENPGTYTKTVNLAPQRAKSNTRRGGWRKFSAYFIVPEPNNTEGQEAIYDGFLAGITLKPGDTQNGDLFYVDDMLVREVTAEELYQSPQRLLGNLLLDPNAEYSNLWEDQSDVVEWLPDTEVDPSHRGDGQLKIVSAGAAAKTFWWTIDELGEPEWIDTQEGEIFYAECWVRSPTRNGGVSSKVHLVLELRNSITGATDTKYVTKTIDQDDDWRLQNKISGTFTIPGPNLTRPRYKTSSGVEWDQVRFGFELVAGQTFEGDEFFIDNMVVKEITGLQKILKGVHEPIFGDSVEYPTYEDMQRGISRLMHRSLGPNLLGDPKITKEDYWTGLPSSVQFLTKSLVNKTRSGLHSLKITSTGAAVSFDWTRDETGEVWPILAEAGNIFYCECWVYAPLSNTPGSILTIHGTAIDTTSEDPENHGVYSKTIEITPIISDTITRGDWQKLSGYYTMPEPNNTEGQEAIYNGFTAGITIKAGDTQNSDVFFIDDLEIREVAKVQKLTDALHQGIFGGTGKWKNPDDIRGGLLGLAALSRGRNKVGSNILPDPKITDILFWSEPGLSMAESPRRSFKYSLELISDGANERSFDFMRSDTGEGIPITAQEGDIFYCECWVRAALGNSDSTATIKLFGKATNSTTGTVTDLTTEETTLTNPIRGVWKRISGLFTIPRDTSVTDDSSSYDQFNVGLSVTTPAGTNYIFNIDDLVVREITVATKANRLADKVTELARRKQKSGSNLVLDPKIEMASADSYWLKNNSALSIFFGTGNLPASSYKRSGSQSLKITIPASGATSFAFTLDDDGYTTPLMAQNDDIFYAECWVKTPSSVTLTLKGKWASSADTSVTKELESYTKTVVSSDGWYKLSGSFAIPADTDAGTGTYDSIIVELGVTGTANSIVYIDDILVRENTLAQNIADNLHRGLFGGVGKFKTPGEFKGGLFNLANHSRRRVRAGSNLVNDPKVENADFWPNYISVSSLSSSLALNTATAAGIRSGSQSLEVTIASGGTTFYWNLDDEGRIAPLSCQNKDIFYAECWVYAAATGTTATLLGRWVRASSVGTPPGTLTYANGATASGDVTTLSLAVGWNKLYGTFTFTTGSDSTAPTYDAVIFGLTVTGTTGTKVYVDDLLVREVTTASEAKTLATGANTLANKAAILGRRKQRAGSNLVLDSKISMSSTDSYWLKTGNTALSIYTNNGLPANTFKRSGTQSLAVTVPAGGTTSFALTLDDDGSTVPLIAQADDIFYGEIWIKTGTSATVTMTGKWANSDNISSFRAANVGTYSKSLTSADGWYKLSGSFTIPPDSDADTGTYDSLVIEVTVAGTSGTAVYVDDIMVRENTFGQNIVDNLHQGMQGGSNKLNGPGVLKTALSNFTTLGRRRNKAGSNLLVDPKIETSDFWSNYATANSLTGKLAINTAVSAGIRSGTQSLAVTSPTSFYWNADDQGTVAPVVTQNEDVFYAECYLYTAATGVTATLDAKWVKASNLTTPAPQTLSASSDSVITAALPVGWTKLFGTFTVPSSGTTYDSVLFGLTFTGTGTVYVDDMLAREITAASKATVTASGAGVLAQKATTLARTKQKAGTNLVLDPKVEIAAVDSYWLKTGNTNLSIYSGNGLPANTFKHSGKQSLAITIPVAATTSVALTMDDDGSTVPLAAQEGDVFYAEVWVKTATSATVSLVGKWTNASTFVSGTASTYTELSSGTYTKALSSSDNWYKLSGNFTIPAATDATNGNYDSLVIELKVDGTATRVVYADDILVRENTFGQNITDNIHQALNGGTSTNRTPGEVNGLFKKLNQSLFRNDALPAASASATVAYDAVPSLDRGKIPHLQNVIDNIHQSVFGGSSTGNDPSVVKTGLLGLANLSRGRNTAGSNLVPDPKINYSNFWTGVTGLALSTANRRSWTQSLELTSAGATARSFYWTVDDTATAQPIVAQEDDIFYVECWIFSPLANSTTATITIFGQAKNSATGTVTDLTPITLVNPARAGWRKISGYFTIPVSGLTDSSNDQFFVGATLAANATTSGNKFYFDDLVIREITVAKTAADNASSALSGNQDTLDAVYQGVAGGSTTGNTRAGLKGLFQNLNQSLFRSNNYPGAAGTVAYASVPELDRAKIPHLQNVIDNVHQSVFGGSATGNDPSVVKTGLLGLANLGRGRNKAGSNLLADPKISYSNFWSGVTGLALSSAVRRSLTQSLELTSAGATERSFYWTVDDTAVLTPIVAQEGDIFYVEVWVYSLAGNAATATITVFGQAKNSTTSTVTNLTSLTAVNPTRGVWTKISGYFTIPASGLTDSSNDQFIVGASLTANSTTSGNKFYFDDLVVREVTVAKGAADNASSALSGNQDTLDFIYQGVAGGTSTGNTRAGLKGLFQNLNQSLFRSNNYPGATGTVAYNAVPPLDRGKIDDLKTTIDGVQQAIYGGTATNNDPTTVKTGLLSLANLGRNRQRAGSNLVLDPKIVISSSSHWSLTGNTALAVSTAYERSGTQSLQLTTATNATAVAFTFTLDDQGGTAPVMAQEADIFYVECYVLVPVANITSVSLTGSHVKAADPASVPTAITPTAGTTYSLSSPTASTTNWVKLSAYFTIPARTVGNALYDSFIAGITMTGTTANTSKIYVDDIVVREITVAQGATGIAAGAESKSQSTIDNIHQAFAGGSGAGTAGGLKTFFQNLHSSLYGQTTFPGSSAAIREDAVPTITVGKGRTKILDLRDTIDGIQQAVYGGSAASNDTTVVKTGLLGLVNLSRGRTQAATNLINDPKVSYSSFWAGITGVTTSSLYSRSTTQSLELTSSGTTEVSFDWNRNDKSEVSPIITQQGDIFQVECWVYMPAATNLLATVRLHGKAVNLATGNQLTLTPDEIVANPFDYKINGVLSTGLEYAATTPTFTLTWGGQTASTLNWNAGSTAIQTALNALTTAADGPAISVTETTTTTGTVTGDKEYTIVMGLSATSRALTGTATSSAISITPTGSTAATQYGSAAVTYSQSSVLSGFTVAATWATMNDNSASGTAGYTGTSYGTDQYVRADLGATNWVSQIVVGYTTTTYGVLPGGYTTDLSEGLQVQRSDNGTTWSTITTTPTYLDANYTWTSGRVTIPINNYCRYIRLFRPGGGVVAVTEFQLWGGSRSFVVVLNPTSNPYKGVWTKVSAQYTIPAPTTYTWDGFVAGVTLPGGSPGGTNSGDKFYVDDLVVKESTLSQNTVDSLANAFTGGDEDKRRTLADALEAMIETRRTLSRHTTQLQELQTSKTSNEVKGSIFGVNFSDYSDGELATVGSADWEVYYPSGAGTTNKIVVSSGLACWNGASSGDRDARIISKNPTATNFQIMRGTMSVPPQTASGGGSPKFHAIGRVIGASGDGTSFVWARAYAVSLFSYKGEIGYTIDGVERVWASDIPLTWSLDMTFKVGSGTEARQYQVYSGSELVKEWDERYVNGVSGTVNTSRSVMDGDFLVSRGAATAGTFTLTYTPGPVNGIDQTPATSGAIGYNYTSAQVKSVLDAMGKGTFYVNSNAATGGTGGPWYISPPDSTSTMTGTGSLTGGTLSVTKQSARRWGSVAQTRNGRHSGKLGGATAADNVTPAVKGSTARMHNTSGISKSLSAGENDLPSGLFDTITYESLDIDAVTSSGTFKVTSEGTYRISVRIEMNTTLTAWCSPVLQVSTNNGSSWTTTQYGNATIPSQAGMGVSGDWIQYLNANDMVRIRFYRNANTSSETLGSTDTGKKTYFAITAIGGIS